MVARRRSILSNLFLVLLTIICGIILVLALYTVFDAQAGANTKTKDYLTYKGRIYCNVTDAKRIQAYGSNPKASMGDFLGRAEEKNIYKMNLVENQSVIVVETRSGYEYYEFVKIKDTSEVDGAELCTAYGIKNESSISRILVLKRASSSNRTLETIEKEKFSSKILGFAGLSNYIACNKKVSGANLWNIRSDSSFKTFTSIMKKATSVSKKTYQKYEKQAKDDSYDFVVLLKSGIYLKGTYTPSIAAISCGSYYILTEKQNKKMKEIFK